MMFGSSTTTTTASKAGKPVFSEDEALKHFKALTELASHPVHPQADLTPALQYVLKQSQNIKEAADKDVDVDVNIYPEKSTGDSNLKNVVLRMLPKGGVSDPKGNAALVSVDIDDAASKEAHGGDKLSSAAFQLELARGVSQSAQQLKNGVIFLFNTGKDSAKNFITQHHWGDTVPVPIDLGSLFTGGKKPSVFQGLVPPQAINSALDFLGKLMGSSPTTNLFGGKGFPFPDKEDHSKLPNLSGGKDFPFPEKEDHSKSHKLGPLKPGSFQHLGDNLLPHLLQLNPMFISHIQTAMMFGLAAPKAGKTVFSEAEALKHFKALTELAPHPIHSKSDHNPTLQYILKEIQNIKEKADKGMDVGVDLFPVKPGDSNLKNVLLKIMPNALTDAKKKAVMVSAHVDATASKEAAEAKLSSAAFLLELARGLTQGVQQLQNGVMLLFNSGKEDAQNFITKNNLSNSICKAIDLESLFTGVKMPSDFQDLSSSGATKSAPGTGLLGSGSGLSSGVEKNQKLDPAKPGSFQNLGDNLLPHLLQPVHTFKG